MTLEKSNLRYNYKTVDITNLKGPEFLDRLGDILDEAGRGGWDLVYMNDDYMILKQTYLMKD